MSTDYLKLLQHARDPQKMAMYVRAFACKVAAYNEPSYVAKCEAHAQILEHCEDVSNARRMLKEWCYIS